MVTYLGSLVELCLGREEHCKQILAACVGSAHHVWVTLGLTQLMMACAFPVYTAQAPGFSAGVLPKVGPAFCAISRSKLLRFRFLGTLQRHRLGWACVLCLSQVQAAQVTRCLVSALSPASCFIISPILAAQFPRCAVRALSQMCHVSPLGS